MFSKKKDFEITSQENQKNRFVTKPHAFKKLLIFSFLALVFLTYLAVTDYTDSEPTIYQNMQDIHKLK